MMKHPARQYHEVTKYAPDLRLDHVMDVANPPAQWRTWHGAKPIGMAGWLPLNHSPYDDPVGEVPPEIQVGVVDLGRVARFLYLVMGVTAIAHHGDTKHLFRAHPSAGALYPSELYVWARSVEGLEPGLYNVHVPTFSLIPMSQGHFDDDLVLATFEDPGFASAPIVLITSGVWHRSSWRYAERGYRRVLLDSGHVLGNINRAAASEQFASRHVASFRDEVLLNLLFMDSAEEGPLVMSALSDISIEAEPFPSPEIRGPGSGLLGVASHFSYEEVSLACHWQGGFTLGDDPPCFYSERTFPGVRGEGVDLPKQDLKLSEQLWHVVSRRRSCRRFKQQSASLKQLGALLYSAYRWGAVPGHSLIPAHIQTYVAVHGVSGLDAGIYQYDALGHRLILKRPGDHRSAIQTLCLGQELGGDASFVVIHTADLTALEERYGSRAYRYIHLDAGMIGQELNLGAVFLGLGASGIGGFFDDMGLDLLGLTQDHVLLYLTTIGHPNE